MNVSPLKRREIIDALRIGAVPRRGLEHFAAGLERFEKPIDLELDSVAAGQGKFKAVRGEYGTGKTFFSRWLEHRALQRGFATTLVQISERDTPLYKMETVYRRAVESLQTKEWSDGAFRSLVDRWFFNLEEEVLGGGAVEPNDADAVAKAVGDLLEKRLHEVSRTQPHFAAALRACHTARVKDDHATAEGLVAWLMGQPNVGAGIKRAANLTGEIDHDGAAGFLRGLLEVLRQTGRKGLVLVLDEVETIQRVRTDSREKSLNALRQLVDDLVADRFPGLYVLITGTPQFFDGPQGVQRSVPLAQRLQTPFGKDPQFDNPKAAQIRLQPFDLDRMVHVGRRIRELYPSEASARLETKVNDAVLRGLAESISGQLGGKVGIAPRIFLKRLVDLLDRVDQFEAFDPVKDYDLVVRPDELTAEERAATGVASGLDEIDLDLGGIDGDEGLG
ncbi:MAG: BREX system ATP-binding protein BrxD [Sandaracinus sp.]|nr:BREX system ATP-binding protein BrxD [Myxococcales bacterium]MCB9616420.1 BREX system ATP-binding protein BrxD [Sandaracinus sp.]MCB9631958.1 BREX system ATP-binding protein BrxD [Sandaracinus sp.]